MTKEDSDKIKTYSNEHPKGKKPTEENTKVARRIRIDNKGKFKMGFFTYDNKSKISPNQNLITTFE